MQYRFMHNLILVELSGESQSLSIAELESAMNTLSVKSRIIAKEDCVAIAEYPGEIQELVNRLALAHSVSIYVQSTDKIENIEISNIKPFGDSFRVRARRIMEYHKEIEISGLERSVGKSIKGKVNLTNPDYEVRILLGKRIHVGVLKPSWKINRTSYELRKPQNRPFFSPITLHPKFARALVNLTEVKKGECILDPFCGTGGILIEAGLVGAKIIGSDASIEMVEGTKKNLSYFGLDGMIFESEIGDISENLKKRGFSKIDCIATDPPYGRAATTLGENIYDLYERAFSQFKKILSKKMAIILPNEEYISLCKRYFKLEKRIPVKVHRSLTRHFCIFSAQ
ncbi:MAG: methyltransferase domain-containing protein [Thermoplasmata archaeon]